MWEGEEFHHRTTPFNPIDVLSVVSSPSCIHQTLPHVQVLIWGMGKQALQEIYSDMNRDHQTQRQPAYYKKNHLLALNLCAIYCVKVT